MFLYVCFDRTINDELIICIESSQRMAAAYFKVQSLGSLDDTEDNHEKYAIGKMHEFPEHKSRTNKG